MRNFAILSLAFLLSACGESAAVYSALSRIENKLHKVESQVSTIKYNITSQKKARETALPRTLGEVTLGTTPDWEELGLDENTTITCEPTGDEKTSGEIETTIKHYMSNLQAFSTWTCEVKAKKLKNSYIKEMTLDIYKGNVYMLNATVNLNPLYVVGTLIARTEDPSVISSTIQEKAALFWDTRTVIGLGEGTKEDKTRIIIRDLTSGFQRDKQTDIFKSKSEGSSGAKSNPVVDEQTQMLLNRVGPSEKKK